MLDRVVNPRYLIAVRERPLTGAATLSFLYPARTSLRAPIVLHERLGAVQEACVAAAPDAVVLMAG